MPPSEPDRNHTDPEIAKRRSSWIERIGFSVLHGVLILLAKTYRFRTTGTDPLGLREPVIFTFWHNRLAGCGLMLKRTLVRRGKPVAVIVSLSRDGELTARAATRAGFLVARGSSGGGGLGALLGARRLIARQRASVITAADGSRGPIYECQQGTIVLSQVTGAPIVPMAFATRRPWRVRSWDRLIVPRPFSRILVALGEPRDYPARLSVTELEQAAVDLGRSLHRLVEIAERELDDPSGP